MSDLEFVACANPFMAPAAHQAVQKIANDGADAIVVVGLFSPPNGIAVTAVAPGSDPCVIAKSLRAAADKLEQRAKTTR